MTQPIEERSSVPPAADGASEPSIVAAPTTFKGILGRIGPGLIIAGSIVGSGELIATTKTGAQAGIALLWLIIVGCVIKVFVQVELGRYAISHGETTLSALNRVPGPRVGVNWIIWLWVVMMLLTIGQLGGIVGGVGQSLALTFPFTKDYREAIRVPSLHELKRYVEWADDEAGDGRQLAALNDNQRERVAAGQAELQRQLDALGERGIRLVADVRAWQALPEGAERDQREAELKSEISPYTYDDKYWAGIVAVLTAGVLFVGRYSLIQNVSMVLVVSFTFITIGNVFSLQMSEEFTLRGSDIIRGLSFGKGDTLFGTNPWVMAFATFGIIGVGASELVAYPYWCLEKGYGQFTGPRSDDDSWAQRARGWMRVMHVDAFASMIVYTIATLAFYFMGVAVLYKKGLDPDGMRMVSTLAEAYVPVFGTYARWLFLLGAIAVLYSTFLVANAANARMITDALKVLGIMPSGNQKVHLRSVSILSAVLPLTCLTIFCSGVNPVTLIKIAGLMQAAMLPIIGFSSVYFRFRLTDNRLRPSRLWDVMLVLSCIGLLIAGGFGIYKFLSSVLS